MMKKLGRYLGMKLRLFIIAATVVIGFTNLALPIAAADAPATREDILKLFDVMQVHEQMRQVMSSMMEQQSALVEETIKQRYPQITQQRLAQFDAMMKESMKDFPVDAMLQDVIPVYQKHLTKTDVEAMSTFYSSATGRKLLREMPEMTSESMEAAYARVQKHMEATMNRLEQMMKEDEPKEKPREKPQSQPRPDVQQD
jgi:uncharacterized protein